MGEESVTESSGKPWARAVKSWFFVDFFSVVPADQVRGSRLSTRLTSTCLRSCVRVRVLERAHNGELWADMSQLVIMLSLAWMLPYRLAFSKVPTETWDIILDWVIDLTVIDLTASRAAYPPASMF